MNYPVWCILVDGPLAGSVQEIDVATRHIQVHCDGVHHYKRSGWGTTDKSHRIVFFRYQKTLVV